MVKITQWHLDTKKKISGGKKSRCCDKRLHEKGGNPTLTTIGEKNKKTAKRIRGGKSKNIIRETQVVSVTDKSTKKTFKAKILKVLENTSNREYVRRSIISKGAKIKVELDGKELEARVTNRPGQSGNIAAEIIKK